MFFLDVSQFYVYKRKGKEAFVNHIESYATIMVEFYATIMVELSSMPLNGLSYLEILKRNYNKTIVFLAPILSRRDFFEVCLIFLLFVK